jgi:hypothetical protein
VKLVIGTEVDESECGDALAGAIPVDPHLGLLDQVLGVVDRLLRDLDV